MCKTHYFLSFWMEERFALQILSLTSQLCWLTVISYNLHILSNLAFSRFILICAAVSGIPEQLWGSSMTEHLRPGLYDSIGLVSSHQTTPPALMQFFSAAWGKGTGFSWVPEISKTERYTPFQNVHSVFFSEFKTICDVTLFEETFSYRISTSPLPTKQTNYSQYIYTHIILFPLFTCYIFG